MQMLQPSTTQSLRLLILEYPPFVYKCAVTNFRQRRQVCNGGRPGLNIEIWERLAEIGHFTIEPVVIDWLQFSKRDIQLALLDGLKNGSYDAIAPHYNLSSDRYLLPKTHCFC